MQMGRKGYQDVDYVLTTRELGRLFRYNKVNMAALPNEKYDSPMGTGSGERERGGVSRWEKGKT